MALVGDAIITRPLSPFKEPEFLRMIELIRGADASFANLEMLFHDFEPYPMFESGGTWMRAEPALAKELAWAGIDIVAMANNHTGDYGVEGLRLTRKYVTEAGLVGAGTGENLPEAREARFFQSANGRVALISVASTFAPHSAASSAHGAVRGRPGLSPLHFTSTRIVSREQLDQLRSALRNAGMNVAATGTTLRIGPERFAAGDTTGVRTEPDKDDVEEIAAVVRNAARLADYVVVSIHCHETGGRLTEPPQFLKTFARAMVDAGADVFIGHGPHVLRGIELYKGKPIFYSLGDFMFENETVLRMPSEAFATYHLDEKSQVADYNAAHYNNDTRGYPTQREIWESVVVRPEWKGKELVAVALYPITLGFGLPAQQRGRPMLASRELAQKIIGDLTTLSKPFGTAVEWREGIGVVRLR
jgi:poly-gamma-glutamate synthesis protein (capsule biosynthesis protein)